MFAEELWILLALLHAREHQQDLVGAPERRRRLVHAGKDRDLDASGEVLDLREHHELLVLGDVLARARDDAGDRDQILPRLAQLGQSDEIVDVLHAGSERIERVR